MLARLFITISLLLSSAGFAAAATPEDVAKVAAMVADQSVPVLDRKTNYVNGEYMGDTAVFVYKGMRYTFYNSGARINPNDPNTAWLSVWVRKNGTSGQATVETFTDHAFNGIVDFGINGNSTKIYDVGMFSETPRGTEYKSYWQTQYDKAIKAAIAYMRHPKR